MKKTILFLFILINHHCVYGQIISGIIQDNQMRTPLYMATIRWGERGILSNSKGYFEFVLKPKDELTKNPLVISYVGYQKQSIPFNLLKGDMNIAMIQISSQLAEIKIDNGAERIIKKMVKSILQNYPQIPYALVGNQTEVSSIENKRILYKMSYKIRAIIPPARSRKKVKQEVYELIQTDIAPLDSIIYGRWGGTGQSIEVLDFLRTPYEILDTTKLSRFNFIVEEKKIGLREVIEIQFYLKKGKKMHVGSNYLMIDKISSALIELSLKDEYVKNDILKIVDGSFHVIPNEIKVTYKEVNGIWYLDKLFAVAQNMKSKMIFKKSFGARTTIEFQTKKIDTLVNFDIDYAHNFQQKDITHRLTMPTTIQTDLSKKYPFKSLSGLGFSARLLIFITEKLRLGVRIGVNPYTNSNILCCEQKLSTKNLGIDQDFMPEKLNTIPINIGTILAFPLNKSVSIETENGLNYGLGGSMISLTSLGLSVSKYFKSSSRPISIFISPKIQIQTESLSKGKITFNQLQSSLIGFDQRDLKVNLDIYNLIASIGLGASVEISRRKKLAFEFSINQLTKQKSYFIIQDPNNYLFHSDNKLIPIDTNPPIKTSFSFAIKYY